MKKIIIFLLLVCVGMTQSVFAQTPLNNPTSNTYLENLVLETNSQSLTGDFLVGEFLNENNGNISTLNEYVEIMSGDGINDSVIGSINVGPGSIPAGIMVVSFTFPASLLASTVNPHDRVFLRWTGATTIYESTPVILSNTQFTGAGASNQPDIISVDWDTPLLKNTASDNSGIWYYEISSNGDVTKISDTDAYLILAKVNNQTGVQNIIILGEYLAGTGLSFPVTYPSCDVGELNCYQVEDSPVEPGHSYEVFFSSDSNGEQILAPFDHTLSLPDVPNQITSSNGFIRMDITDFNQHPNNGEIYVGVTGSVLQNVTGQYRFSVIAEDTDGSRDDINYSIGFVPGIAGPYSVPSAGNSYPMDTSFDNYKIVVEYNNQIIEQIDIGPFEEVVQNTTGGGSLFGGYSAEQQTILDEGIVPTDCGYGIGPDGSGRMCGFADIIQLIQNAIEYIFILILPIAALMFAYAGFLLLTSGGDPNKKKAAKNAIVKVIVGIVIIMLAWLLVKTILVALGASAGFTMFLDF